MKRIAILLFAFISALSANCQTYILDGDRCFGNGDYTCAVKQYNEAFKLASGKDKQIAEIKLTRAKWCADHTKTANQAFASKNYKIAKENYQRVLESNPKDEYTKSQLDKCNNPVNHTEASTLHKATTTELTDIWNNKYGVMPARRQMLIDAGIDPDDAQRRINSGEGKPTNVAHQEIKLSVAKENVSFSSSGGVSDAITVNTNAGTYSVSLIPWYCSVQTYKNHLIVTCKANYTSTSRSEWFKVIAGDIEVKIYVNQTGNTHSSVSNNLTEPIKNRKCFNCPKAKYTWGITAGYIQRTSEYSDGLQLGIKVEPLFKNGFGVNTGLNFIGYSTELLFALNGVEEFEQYALNIPLHLEYRLNFSKWFNVFAYGGAGLNVVTNSLFDEYSMPTTFEYGGGLRINHLQFTIGQSDYIGNLKDIQDFGTYRESYQKLILSVSYMF